MVNELNASPPSALRTVVSIALVLAALAAVTFVAHAQDAPPRVRVGYVLDDTTRAEPFGQPALRLRPLALPDGTVTVLPGIGSTVCL